MNSQITEQVLEKVLEDLRAKSQAQKYFNDPVLWAKEVLGYRLWSAQEEIARKVVDNKRVVVKAGHGVGKLVNGFTPVLTTEGWKNACDLTTQDTVFDEQGKPTRITGVSEVWDRPEYKITFDDGTEILAGPEHEWNVLDLCRRNRADGTKNGVSDWRDYWHTTKTYETQELYEMGVKTASNQNRWRIPTARPLQLPEADLPIHPYLLGLWLGDGSSNAGVLTIGKSKEGVLDWLTENGYKYNAKWVEYKNCYTVRIEGLSEALSANDLRDNKHIPVAYLLSSETQRRELLAGLLDTDGYLLTGKTSVFITQVREGLIKEIRVLVQSLGYKVFLSEKDAAYTLDGKRHVTGTAYTLVWNPEQNPFKVKNQHWQPAKRQQSRHTQRTIVSIEKTGNRVKNFCIEVDSPSHLYLVGESFVPTHNSMLAGVLACWWISTRGANPKEVMVVTTAPSLHQVHVILWAEISKNFSTAKLRYDEGLTDTFLQGYITQDDQWKVNAGGETTMIGFGRKPQDGSVSTFQGIHRKYVLAILDEAAGISEDLWMAVEAITTTPHCRTVAIANPDSTKSHLYKIFKMKDAKGLWVRETISLLDSPHFTKALVEFPDEYEWLWQDDRGKWNAPHPKEWYEAKYEEDKDLPQEVWEALTTTDWATDLIRAQGRESPFVKVKVFAEFADMEEIALFSRATINKAIDNEIITTSEDDCVLGVDLSRYGNDYSAIYSNIGGKVRLVDHWGGKADETKVDGMESAAKVNQWAKSLGAIEVRVDEEHIGGPILDEIVRLSQGSYRVVGMRGNGASPDKYRFRNGRAYWYDTARQLMFDGKIDIDGNDEKLVGELEQIQYHFNNPQRSLQIESKDEMRKRGVKSPDFADAFVYAVADISYITENPLSGFKPGSQVSIPIEALLGALDRGYSPY